MKNLFAALIIFAAGIVYGKEVASATNANVIDMISWHRGWDKGWATCNERANESASVSQQKR